MDLKLDILLGAVEAARTLKLQYITIHAGDSYTKELYNGEKTIRKTICIEKDDLSALAFQLRTHHKLHIEEYTTSFKIYM